MNDDVIELDILDPDIEIVESLYCWCCGYPSDDLAEIVLEDGLRKKHNIIICGICLDAPYVLDSYLNPWLYENNSQEVLMTLSYMTNDIIATIRNQIKE